MKQKNHEKQCRPPGESCGHCGKFFEKRQKLELHEKKCRVYNCNYCNIRYKNKSRVEHHEKCARKRISIICWKTPHFYRWPKLVDIVKNNLSWLSVINVVLQ